MWRKNDSTLSSFTDRPCYSRFARSHSVCGERKTAEAINILYWSVILHSQTSILSNSQRSEESRENWPIQQLAVIWNTCRWKQCRLPVGFNYKSALWAACINSSFKRISALSLKTGTTSTEHSLQQTFSAPCANPSKSSSRMVLDFFCFLPVFLTFMYFQFKRGKSR